MDTTYCSLHRGAAERWAAIREGNKIADPGSWGETAHRHEKYLYATDIKLHVHTYAVGVADVVAREGSPHNVLHSSS